MLGIAVWRKSAVCKETVYRPEFDKSPKRAKAVCRICPVASDCLKYALVHNEQGVWGGTTEEDREAMNRDQPEIRLSLIAEARLHGLLESRYSVEQYWQELREARKTGF